MTEKPKVFNFLPNKILFWVKQTWKAIENELTDSLRPLKNVVAEKAKKFYFNLKLFRNRFVTSKCEFFERKYVFFFFFGQLIFSDIWEPQIIMRSLAFAFLYLDLFVLRQWPKRLIFAKMKKVRKMDKLALTG